MPIVNRYQMPDLSVQLTDELIMRHIERGSRVIDLGCGDGRLMQRLRDEMSCTAMGVPHASEPRKPFLSLHSAGAGVCVALRA